MLSERTDDLEPEGEQQPRDVGVSSDRIAHAVRLLDDWVAKDLVPGVAAVVLRHGQVVARHFRGLAVSAADKIEPRAVGPETLFTLPSISKALTATAFMLLVESGLVILDDLVTLFIPEFGKIGKDQIRVRHLLTHTSGLPDMLSNNDSLRKAHHGLPYFVRSAFRHELAFTPGTRISYSSTGYLMLAEIAERVTRQPFPEFLAERLLRPIGLPTAGLRPADALYPRIARLLLPEGRPPTSWDNNSPYWRQLGAPWGGVYATADELAAFGQFVLDSRQPPRDPPGGPRDARRADGLARSTGSSLRPVSAPAEPDVLLSPAAAQLMTRNQTKGIPPAADTLGAWGFGWELPVGQFGNWAGDFASAETFGHHGASGTMLWIDPIRQLVCVVLTNRVTNWSAEYRRFAAFSNAVQASVVGT